MMVLPGAVKVGTIPSTNVTSNVHCSLLPPPSKAVSVMVCTVPCPETVVPTAGDWLTLTAPVVMANPV